jgi:signal recognition particle receptor subunit beta
VKNLAILDTENNQIVIRLVYDGPPFSGKTTTLRALAGSFARDVYTPEEANGRTVYFDWMDYTGGLFEGYQIRCQLVSVPGQFVLAGRRQQLIETADVIVFVGDTAHDEIDESISHLKNLVSRLQTFPGPPIGIIFQANKRDHPEAVEMAEIEKQLGRDMKGISIVESVAKDGVGVRQAFIFGVRLSLDRVRELIRTDSLERGKPQIDSGYDLLQSIKESESNSSSLQMTYFPVSSDVPVSDPDPMVGEALQEALSIEEEVSAAIDSVMEIKVNENGNGTIMKQESIEKMAQDSVVPLPPDPTLPGGLIWPPIEGRMVLHEVSNYEVSASRNPNGDWSANQIGLWRIHSYLEAEYEDINQGRQHLIQWAHLHVAALPMLSPRRCLALADTGEGKWRLWQVIRVEKSLREYLYEVLAENDLGRIAEGILETAHMLLTGAEKLKESPCPLPCSIDSLACIDSMVYYNGLMPDYSSEADLEPSEDLEVTTFLKDQMGAILSHHFRDQKESIPALIDSLVERSDSSIRSQRLLESLTYILEDLFDQRGLLSKV